MDYNKWHEFLIKNQQPEVYIPICVGVLLLGMTFCLLIIAVDLHGKHKRNPNG